MKKHFVPIFVYPVPVVLLIMTLAAPNAHGQAAGCTDQALQLAEGQLIDTLKYISASQFPEATDPKINNRWTTDAVNSWNSGFFPGWIWYMYEQTLNPSYLTRAKAQTASLAGEATDASGHDVGFRIMTSYGNGYRITRDPSYMSTIQTAAKTLATLYRPFQDGTGVIESWLWYDSTNITVIIDGMMNLELLFYASQNGGDPAWYDMAVKHAYKTMVNNVRPDGSTFQVVDYNPVTGAVAYKSSVDGYSTDSTWARGQAWGVYGFTMAYRYTRNPDFLATAQKLADYFIAHLELDSVPVWDFSYPSAYPRDSSAAAIAAAGILELSTYMSDPTAYYYNAALNIQTSLSNPALYLGDRLLTDGVILHGSHEVPQNVQVDTSLIWGDYYFIQGCHRAKAVPPQVTNLAPTLLPSGQVGLAWYAQPGAIRYSVKRSTTAGGPYATIAPPPVLTTNSFTDTSVAGNTTYHYVVSAISVAGEGPNSLEVAVVTAADTTPPTVSITSPANGSTVSKTVTVTATATDNVGVVGVQFWLDGTTKLGREATSAPYSVSWDTTTGAIGSHTLTAVARDASGNQGVSAPVKVNVVGKHH